MLSSHQRSLEKQGLTWNQMALTILLRTNKGRTQRALKTEVRKNSNQDHTLPWRDGSPGGNKRRKNSLLTDCFLPQTREPDPDSQAAIRTDDFCSESLQQWDKHPVEEKQTELETERMKRWSYSSKLLHTDLLHGRLTLKIYDQEIKNYFIITLRRFFLGIADSTQKIKDRGH